MKIVLSRLVVTIKGLIQVGVLIIGRGVGWNFQGEIVCAYRSGPRVERRAVTARSMLGHDIDGLKIAFKH